MQTKRRHEGYLLIDHRAGDGIDASFARRVGGIAVPGGSTFESATFTCSHCQVVVILNPDRARARGYCPKCDHHICDRCETTRALTGACKPFKQILDEAQERASRRDEIPRSQILALA
jgi:hypothetical protein